MKKLLLLLMMFIITNTLISQNYYVKLIQPNEPNIEWTVGGVYVISWTDNFDSPVDIYFSSDNGQSYSLIESNVTGSVYYWNTNGYPLSKKCKIQITNSINTTIYDISDHRFKLVDQTNGFITLNQPIGNEIWSENNSYLISWNDNLNEPVKIELLKNNHVIKTISQSTLGSTFTWTIPSGLSNVNKVYKIKISSTVPNATTSPAISGKFKILESAGTYINVIQPNGGNRWVKGNTYLISWIDDIPEPVNIELWKGNSYYKTIATNVIGSTYYWTISNNLQKANNYKIIIRSSLSHNLYDKSNRKFKIVNTNGTFINIYQPQKNDKWSIGTTHLISWLDDMIEPVNIELWKNNSLYKILATNVIGSTYYWNIDQSINSGNNYKIKIISSSSNNLHKFSKRFKITESSGSYIEVIQPNGGESWAANTQHLLSWTDDLTEPVNIELLKGGTVYSTIATNVIGSTYSWSIPSNQLNGSNYKIKITSSLDGSIKDISDSKFSITLSSGTYIEIIQPNGGENWICGNSYLISWIDDIPEPVNIELWKGNSYNSTIATNVIGSTYSWLIPSNQLNGSNYKIKIYSTLDGSLKDFSNSNFSIISVKYILYPNPSKNNLNIKILNKQKNYHIIIFNKVNKILEFNSKSENINIPLTNLKTGLYFISINGNVSKFIKK